MSLVDLMTGLMKGQQRCLADVRYRVQVIVTLFYSIGPHLVNLFNPKTDIFDEKNQLYEDDERTCEGERF